MGLEPQVHYIQTHVKLPFRLRALIVLAELRFIWKLRSYNPRRWRKRYEFAQWCRKKINEEQERAFLYGPLKVNSFRRSGR